MARILVVDDDPMICDTIELMLSYDGHEVVTASEGATALASTADSPFEVAIVDILMPVKEGIETIQELRASLPRLFIIAMSGGSRIGGTDFLTMAVKLGADVALRKPVAGKVLRNTISDSLASR